MPTHAEEVRRPARRQGATCSWSSASPPRPPLDGPAAALDAALGGVVAAPSRTARSTASPARRPSSTAPAAWRRRGSSSWAWARAARTTGAPPGAAARARRRRSAPAVGRAGPAGRRGAAEVGALIEGLGTGAYRFDRFKTTGDAQAGRRARLAVHSAALRAADVRRADRVVEAVNGARDLANTPANHLTPTMLADAPRSSPTPPRASPAPCSGARAWRSSAPGACSASPAAPTSRPA